ncbi:hypothetical protein QYE76_023806 [Lolium multiflorum]|uniref:Uncharacterized protein n=1 Tax=Lolium multiflorum TaxID=4521 RepID=A0AAD8VT46_LOLMU|nr:hypothetical protein QYE76_023806 [Lolium multiflorum]
MENYSLLMGDSSVDEDGGGVDGGAFRALPRPGGVPEQRLLSPDLGFAMAAALDGFSSRGFSPLASMENYSSSWETAAVMKMAVVSMEKPSGALPHPGGVNRDSCPPDLGFAMAAALDGFSYRGFSVSMF